MGLLVNLYVVKQRLNNMNELLHQSYTGITGVELRKYLGQISKEVQDKLIEKRKLNSIIQVKVVIDLQ